MRRFFSPPGSFVDSTVTLSPEETRHLRDVLRLRAGEGVRVFDGEGREFEATIQMISKAAASLLLVNEVPPTAPESPIDLTLAATVLKGEKFDLVVQKAVELGVSRLTPLTTVRSDVRPRDGVKKVERWRKIVLEATKQCGRAKLMLIDDLTDVRKFATKGSGHVFFFTEREGAGFPDLIGSKTITAFIGPEGGWDNSELEFAKSASFQLVTLGGRILRAETAALTVAAIIQHRFGDVN